MKRVLKNFWALCLLVGLSASLLAQTADAQKKKKDKDKGKETSSAQYSGGGIRGVVDSGDEWLVTPGEALQYRGEDGYYEAPALRMRSVAPAIDILMPELSSELKVKVPFTIAVQFTGRSDAPIDPATFKVLYGAMKYDITSKIIKNATLSKEGFKLENAQIPVGKHKLILQVFDEKQRSAERELRFEVE